LSNEIILTIKGPGEKLILNNEYKYHPFEIEINGEKIPYTSILLTCQMKQIL
jgi:hypothetical protein